eukprot:g40043.t1
MRSGRFKTKATSRLCGVVPPISKPTPPKYSPENEHIELPWLTGGKRRFPHNKFRKTYVFVRLLSVSVMVVHITIPRTHGERMRLPKMVYEPSALDSKSVQKAKILSASMVNAGRTFRSKATSYSVYEVEVKGAGIDKIVPKRWSDFVVFDETWRRLYPNVHNIYYLPKDTLMSLVAKNSYGVTAYRREGLEVYLQGLSKVSAITPLLEAFLELPPNTLQRKKGQSAKQLRSGLNTANTENKGELVKVLSPEELSAKGNTDMAALKAHQQHERFVAQHEGILASLMPGRQLNLNPKAFLLG